MSQEHGILGLTRRRSDAKEGQQQQEQRHQQHQQDEEDMRVHVEDGFEVGQRVQLYCNHVCITAAAFHAYFVVDADDVVRETWVPLEGLVDEEREGPFWPYRRSGFPWMKRKPRNVAAGRRCILMPGPDRGTHRPRRYHGGPGEIGSVKCDGGWWAD